MSNIQAAASNLTPTQIALRKRILSDLTNDKHITLTENYAGEKLWKNQKKLKTVLEELSMTHVGRALLRERPLLRFLRSEHGEALKRFLYNNKPNNKVDQQVKEAFIVR